MGLCPIRSSVNVLRMHVPCCVDGVIMTTDINTAHRIRAHRGTNAQTHILSVRPRANTLTEVWDIVHARLLAHCTPNRTTRRVSVLACEHASTQPETAMFHSIERKLSCTHSHGLQISCPCVCVCACVSILPFRCTAGDSNTDFEYNSNTMPLIVNVRESHVTINNMRSLVDAVVAHAFVGRTNADPP